MLTWSLIVGPVAERSGGDAVVEARRAGAMAFPPRWVKYPRWQWDVWTSAQIEGGPSKLLVESGCLAMRLDSKWAKSTF